MKLIYLLLLIAITLSTASNAGLIDRGNGMIYDDVLNITWLQDVNFANTSGYTVSNATSHPRTKDSIYSDGRMGWKAANDWADQLVFGGYNDWRLPTVTLDEIDPTRTTFSELVYMFHVNLNNTCTYIDCTRQGINGSFIDSESGELVSFKNNIENSYGYWSDTAVKYENIFTGTEIILVEVESPVSAISYVKDENWHERAVMYVGFGAWAVRDGDVAQIPEPSTLAIFSLALFGLLSRKKSF